MDTFADFSISTTIKGNLDVVTFKNGLMQSGTGASARYSDSLTISASVPPKPPPPKVYPPNVKGKVAKMKDSYLRHGVTVSNKLQTGAS